ncbi:hypothetical protein GP486_003799 [Trichoglossum hirsutum]|uniref:Uncharacterized protein n=1 Tax=Trichoglossum hirsutum TaxID=265104 RepID=A0A9P8LBZ8_9PEZI|nr:hypothetical protein GP486_003799 [Trichoglossum hirsutum]
MVLFSYPVAARMIRRSEAGQLAALPTPYQLNMLVGVIGGGFGTLWSAVKYVFGWRGRKPGVVPELWWSMLMMVIAIILSILISLADTWLHVTTKTISFVQVSAVGKPDHALGRGLSSTCLDTYNSKVTNNFGVHYPCTLDVALSNVNLLGTSEAYKTVNNISTTNQVDTVSFGSTYALLVDADPPSDIDYSATTFAVSTQCTSIGHECGLNPALGISTPFNCPNINFKGDVTSGPDWNLNFFNTSEAKYNATLPMVSNPYYWALASLIDGSYPIINSKDPNIVVPVHGGLATVIFCNTTVFDATYYRTNGTITKLLGTISNATVGGIFSGPINPFGGHFGANQLQNGMHLAAFGNTSQDIATAFANTFSQVTVGFAAGVMSPRQNTLEQDRHNLLVARVPKAPLYTLVVLNLLYALLGIVLAVIALFLPGRGLKDVQAKLTIAGLTAEGLERSRLGRPAGRVEELFEEWDGNGSARVAVQQTQAGGWTFATSAKI